MSRYLSLKAAHALGVEVGRGDRALFLVGKPNRHNKP